MSKAGLVFYNHVLSGRLELRENEFIFAYDNAYLNNSALPPISLSFPKSQKIFRSPFLFPFFFGLLAEGANKQIQCLTLKIDSDDHFTRLLKTSGETTIGAVTVKEEL